MNGSGETARVEAMGRAAIQRMDEAVNEAMDEAVDGGMDGREVEAINGNGFLEWRSNPQGSCPNTTSPLVSIHNPPLRDKFGENKLNLENRQDNQNVAQQAEEKWIRRVSLQTKMT